jgi:DNA-directed RNA polymerase subunit RPC12/RpoP
MIRFSKYFTCINCGKDIPYKAWGTKNRNHCPFCLYSLHVDNIPGDRKSMCRGIMVPIGKLVKEDGEESVVHKCSKCGLIRKNRIAGDDSVELVAALPIYDGEI